MDMTTKTSDLLPDSRLKVPKGAKWHKSAWWVPVFCANCGIPYGYVPEENCQFACWLCDACADKHGAVAGTLMMPDEVFWKKVEEAQLEKHGRLLSQTELVEQLQDSGSMISKLAKEKV